MKFGLPVAVTAGVSGWLGVMQMLPLELVVALAAGAAAAVAIVVLAIDTGARRVRGPTRGQIEEALALLRGRLDADRAASLRAERMRDVLALLAAEPQLRALEAELQDNAATIEHFDTVAAALPAWQGALARWYAIAETLAPSVRPIADEAKEDDLRDARARLPFSRNLSSVDLKAALNYLVQAKRWTKARYQLAEYRAEMLRDLSI